MIILSRSTEETQKLAAKLARDLSGGEVLCLYGPLGAGKTSFTAGIINYFLPKKRILSPTFIIVRHYAVSSKKIKNIFHVDLYRLNNTENWQNIGLNEILQTPKSVTIIEWAQRLKGELPSKRTDIKFIIKDGNNREISIIQI